VKEAVSLYNEAVFLCGVLRIQAERKPAGCLFSFVVRELFGWCGFALDQNGPEVQDGID
jgi:hypothetical protein